MKQNVTRTFLKFIPDKFEDYNLGRASQKALRTVPPTRSQDIAYLRHF